MLTSASSQTIRDTYGLFWRRRSGRRLPDELRGISFANASTFSTRVRVRLLKEISRRHQTANPSVSCFVTNYVARPELKIRERRGPISSFTYTQAIQKFPQHLTHDFLKDLYLYATTNLPQAEVIERFLILTPDLLDGPSSISEAVPMSVDEVEVIPPVNPTTSPSAVTSTPAPSTPTTTSTLATSGGVSATVVSSQVGASPPVHSQASTSPTYAVLTPVQFTPPPLLHGPGLLPTPTGAADGGANGEFITVHKWNRNRFAKKSAPYPQQ